jgi:uncharacterized protein YqeY
MNRNELSEGIKTALKAHDKVRLMTLRSVLGEVKNLEVDKHAEASEQEIATMAKRVLKQTSETLEMSRKADNNPERTDELEQRVAILEDLIPQQLGGDALEALVSEVIAETGSVSKRDMGKVMAALGVKTDGNFDKAAAAKMVGAKLA